MGHSALDNEKSTKIFVDESDYVEDEFLPAFKSKDVCIREKEKLTDFYRLLEELGTGSFGTVFRCEEKATGKEFAAKYIQLKFPKQKKEVEHEIEIMKCLQHPRIIQLYDVFAGPSNSYILVMEKVEGGELFERLVDEQFVLTENAIRAIVRQICDAIRYIHAHNIVHLDVKPENILFLTLGGNRVKLIDFGLAQNYSPDKELKIIAGTAEFVAPEVINFENIDFKADMWSIGVILFILLSGESPFLGDTVPETYANVTKGEWDFDESFAQVSSEAKDLVSKLLVYKPLKRLSSKETLEHPWLSRHWNNPNHLNKHKLKQYVIKSRWRKAFNVIRALKRMGWDFGRFSRFPPRLKIPLKFSCFY